ncbi:stage II sporulation protein P [Clostridium carnis]
MYQLREGINSRQQRKISRGKSKANIPGVGVGYIMIIALIVVFFSRAIGVINRHSERGGYAYVQLLNIGMPIVKEQTYNEENYMENKLSLKTIISEALGVGNINAYGIIGKEISFFRDESLNNSIISKHIPSLKPFNLNDNSIAKVTPEELAELNKVSAAYDPSLKKALDNSKPEILLYHTHTTENYSESKKDTTDSNFNVVGVGDVLTKELEEGYGISVIHDKTNHSVVYNNSYARSNETVKSYLDKYGDFKLIIDLHRDGSENKNAVTANLNGQDLAKMMFVTAENSQKYSANKALADKLYGIGKSLFPDLIKPTYIYEYGQLSINSGLSDGALLIEVGANINTAQEAKLTAKYIARILAEHLNRQ